MGDARAFFALCALGIGVLAGCAGEDATSSAPQSPSPANSAPAVVENINYTTNVYGPATINTASAPDAASQAAQNGEANVVVDAPVVVAPGPDDDASAMGEPTGVVECDRYLARVSFCTHRMFLRGHANGDPSAQIDKGLETARRAWRGLLRVHPEMHDLVARECSDARATYESSLKGKCEP